MVRRPVEGQAIEHVERMRPDEPVKDRRAIAIALGWRFQPFLMRFFREDVDQEVDLLTFAHPEEMLCREWSNLVQRSLYELAKSYGIKRGRGDRGFFQKETPVAYLRESDEEDEDLREERIQVLLGVDFWPAADLWLADAYEFCREVLSGGDIWFRSDEQRADWALFNAWFTGWSEEEIRFAFGITDGLRTRLVELATRIRKAAGIEEFPDPLPMPRKLGHGAKQLFDLAFNAGKTEEAEEDQPDSSRPRFVIPSELTVEEIRKRFWVSRATVYRAKERGWLVPGDKIPEKPVPPETKLDVETSIGRRQARNQMLSRDGWWTGLGAMWTTCGLCGKPVLVSAATIDHIVPRSEGGPDVFGNLHLAHYECNQLKGAKLPTIVSVLTSQSRASQPSTEEV